MRKFVLALCFLMPQAVLAQSLVPDFERRDHRLHALAGTGVYLGTRVLTNDTNMALGGCVAAGVGKEVYDRVSRRGDVEASDVVATALPCVVMWAGEHLFGTASRGSAMWSGSRPSREARVPVSRQREMVRGWTGSSGLFQD